MPDANDTKQYGSSGPGQLRLSLIGAVLGLAALVVPAIASAKDAPDPANLSVLLASASTLTDSEMAAQSGGKSQSATLAPNVQAIHPKVHLWDELVPTLSATMGNQSTTITMHTGP